MQVRVKTKEQLIAAGYTGPYHLKKGDVLINRTMIEEYCGKVIEVIPVDNGVYKYRELKFGYFLPVDAIDSNPKRNLPEWF